jgi:hypothetical protein
MPKVSLCLPLFPLRSSAETMKGILPRRMQRPMTQHGEQVIGG